MKSEQLNFKGKLAILLTFGALSGSALSADKPTWIDTEKHLEWVYLGTGSLAAARGACESEGADWYSISDVNMYSVLVSLHKLAYGSPLSASFFSTTHSHSSTPDGQTKIEVPTRVVWVPSQDTRDGRVKEYHRRAVFYRDLSDRLYGENPPCRKDCNGYKVARWYSALSSELESERMGVTMSLHNEWSYVRNDDAKWIRTLFHSSPEDVRASSYLANIVCFRVL